MNHQAGDANLKPFYIDDLGALRERLARAEREGTVAGRVWSAMRRCVADDPHGFHWHTPFVALATEDPAAVEAARDIIRSYVAALSGKQFSAGLQFHFWCFAFPHARWSIYFQWMHAIGVWDEAEVEQLSRALVEFQYLNFFYGLRTKPEPECADNQTMSLALSNGLLGTLFPGAMAERMRQDGLRRLPDTIGGMPPSGYSGEGSTYMSHVVGPSLPFVVELLETAHGGDWFNKELDPDGGSAATICRMNGRLLMPGGYMLPWDHYGYGTGTRACLAYAARKSRDPWYLGLLENVVDWSHEESGGWGMDDLVWSLVWWPDDLPAARPSAHPSWAEEKVGGALVSADANLYLMQMWDRSEPKLPTRQHVNPNNLVLAAYGVPLSIDGVPDKTRCEAFDFADTWREIRNADFTAKRDNFGCGCGGAHSVILVDGWEGMRAFTDYDQSWLTEFSTERQTVAAEVTPIYRERWPDARRVVRRSRLCADRFWLIEDLVAFAEEHEVTARWYLRPKLLAESPGIVIETREGVQLHLLPVLGPDVKTVTPIPGYPDRVDGESLRVDFRQRGTVCRWLWVAWPQQTRPERADVSDGWQALADLARNLDVATARDRLVASENRLPFTAPPHCVDGAQPLAPRWWYRRRLEVPADGGCWLRLPAGLIEPAVWLDGQPVELDWHGPTAAFLPPPLDLAAQAGRTVEVVVRTDVTVAHVGKQAHGAFAGRPALLVNDATPALQAAHYENGDVIVRGTNREWRIPYSLLEDNHE